MKNSKVFLMCCLIAVCLLSVVVFTGCLGLAFVLPDSGVVTYHEDFLFYIHGRDVTGTFALSAVLSALSIYPSIKFSNTLDKLSYEEAKTF